MINKAIRLADTCRYVKFYRGRDVSCMDHRKYIYLFNEGNAGMRDLLGGKGANLAEMTNLGIPVPSGFTISTEACIKYYEDGKVMPEIIVDQIYTALEKIEGKTGKKIWKCKKSIIGFRKIRSQGFHARDDGYHPQCRTER